MNLIQRKKLSRRQYNRLLHSVVTIIKYNKSIIDHAIYINIFYHGTVSYLAVSTDDAINANHNETEFTELPRVLEEKFEIRFQYVSVLKYLN